MQLLRYDLEVRYKAGSEMHIPDALSRATLNDDPPPRYDETDVMSVIAQLPITDNRLAEVREETTNDPVLQEVVKTIAQGWPEKREQVPRIIRPYHTFRHDITYCNGLLFRDCQIIIPTKLRPEMLQKVHLSHQGIVKSKQRARSIMFWPGMNGQIEDICQKCSVCMEFRNKRSPEPLISHDIPDRPWCKVGTDLFELGGKDYLIMTDYYSKFPEVEKIHNKTAYEVVNATKSIFARSGTAEIVVSDNGPCFNSATYKQFATEWGFEHVTISPGFSQSNGQVENAVKSVKRLMKKANRSGQDPYNALMEFRNTPLDGTNGYSPSQLLNSRVLRSKLPTATSLLKPHVVPPMTKQLKERQQKQKEYFDRNASHNIPQPQAGQSVRFQLNDTWQYGTVKDTVGPRSVLVENMDGRQSRRNRRHTFITQEPTPAREPSAEEILDSEKIESTPLKSILRTTSPDKPSEILKTTRSGRVIKPVQRMNI